MPFPCALTRLSVHLLGTLRALPMHVQDLWKTDDPHVLAARGKKRQLLDLVTEGYDEIARYS